MDSCLQAFGKWLFDEVGWTLDDALENAERADLSLRAYGKFCFSSGRPRYVYVYAITAVQHLRPQFKVFLGGAWKIDKQWQIEEPGQCRAVLSAAMVRGIMARAFLWDWHCFGGIVAIGCAGMLHPNEFICLERRDLIFPSDSLSDTQLLYVHIKNPKTARFARKQHVRIDDFRAFTGAVAVRASASGQASFWGFHCCLSQAMESLLGLFGCPSASKSSRGYSWHS